MKKRFLAGLLTAAMLLSLIPTAAFAEETTKTEETSSAWSIEEPPLEEREKLELPADYEPEGLVLVYDPPMLAGTGAGLDSILQQMQALSQEVREALLTGESEVSIDISDAHISVDDDLINYLCNYCPYTDENCTNCRLYYSGTEWSEICVENTLTAEQSRQWVNAIDAELDQLLSAVDTTASAADQALAVHDYMASHYQYDFTFSRYTASGLLSCASGVCMAYAFLFEYVMNRLGFNCYYTASTNMNHGWDILQIGSNYYHVDVTWDDSSPDQFGQAGHDYFLLSDDTIRERGHYDWDLTQYVCSDPSYEDDYFINASSPVVANGTNRYYIDTDGLECYNVSTGKTTPAASLGEWIDPSDGMAWMGSFSGLWKDNGKLFYNTADSIMCYDLSTGKTSVFSKVSTTNGEIYGSRCDEGEICYLTAESPNEEYGEEDIQRLAYIHDWGSGTVTIAPTCANVGFITYTCSICGAVKNDVIPAEEHIMDEENAIPDEGFDCTEGGWVLIACKNCSVAYWDWRDPAEHSWDSGVVTTPVTAAQDGVITYTCTFCGATTEKTLPAGGSPFLDVQNEDAYYYKAVLWAVNKGITQGLNSYTFAPNNACNRGQVVTFLWRAAGCPEPTISENPFSDVSESSPFYKAILWAVENGVTNGYQDGTFRPRAKVTRAQFVTFLWRYENSPEPEDPVSSFSDVYTGYYYKAVLWAAENGVTSGYQDGTFRPNNTCTRANVVTFLYRHLGKS